MITIPILNSNYCFITIYYEYKIILYEGYRIWFLLFSQFSCDICFVVQRTLENKLFICLNDVRLVKTVYVLFCR